MSNSFEKSVKGGTKVKLAPPKSKYVEHILMATQSGEAGVAEVFRTLTNRLRDSTWTIAFKSLIIVHLMIKEGAQDVTLSYLSAAPRNRLAINNFTDSQTQGQNIRRYSDYLLARAGAYASTKCDYVRSGQGRMKRLTVNKGLLRETEVVQAQVRALVKCSLLTNDAENEISLTAFRLLTRDLLDLYNAENEAVMSVLSHYFEMSRPDAERAIKIYKRFCTQTDEVVHYLSVARQFEHATRLQIPKLKHAPTSLSKSLQDYLDDKDFEVNRRQYLAEQEIKKFGKPISNPSTTQSKEVSTSAPTQTSTAPTASSSQPAKGPAPDLIDFFDSIEMKQLTMAQDPQQYQQAQMPAFSAPQQQQSFGMAQPQPTGFQQNGFATAETNPFLQQHQAQQFQQQQQQPSQLQPVQTNYTGAGFGGFGPQSGEQQFVGGGMLSQQSPPPQQNFASPPQIQSPIQMQSPQQTGGQSSNPFRQSMMPTGADSVGFGQPQRQNTNPFTRNNGIPPIPENIPAQHSVPQQQQQQQAQPLMTQQTGTNPFARGSQSSTPVSAQNTLQVQATGSTNPFRQSAFVNQQTGMGWQNAPQATMGGWENLETVPIFPRPGASPTPPQQQPQHQQQQSPWG